MLLTEDNKMNLIIAVTANAFEEDKQLAMAAGMNSHLAKPYDIAQIRDTLAALLK